MRDAHEQQYTTEVITQELELKTRIEEVQTNISTSGQVDATPAPAPTPVQQEASNRGVLQTLSQSAIAVDEAVRETYLVYQFLPVRHMSRYGIKYAQCTISQQ